MWIKWKYVDHGHPDFKEAEIPDDLSGETSVEDYICEAGWVPTWSERFMSGRIQWEKLDKPSKEFIEEQIKNLKVQMTWRRHEIKRFQGILKGLDNL